MAEIDELFVRPQSRGRGLGQALLAAARTGLAGCECRWLQMQVADDNPDAQHFYARLGFRQKKRLPPVAGRAADRRCRLINQAAGLNRRCGPHRLPHTSKMAAHGHPHR